MRDRTTLIDLDEEEEEGAEGEGEWEGEEEEEGNSGSDLAVRVRPPCLLPEDGERESGVPRDACLWWPPGESFGVGDFGLLGVAVPRDLSVYLPSIYSRRLS